MLVFFTVSSMGLLLCHLIIMNVSKLTNYNTLNINCGYQETTYKCQ